MLTGLFVLKATLILLLALVLDSCFRQRAVLACTAMWNAVLLGLIFLPVTVLTLPPINLPLLTMAHASSAIASTFGSIADSVESARPLSAPLADPLHPPTEPPITAPLPESETISKPLSTISRRQDRFNFNWPFALIMLYATGVTVCVLRIILGLTAVRAMIATSLPVPAEKWQHAFAYWKNRLGCRRVELRQSSRVEVPLMAGLLQPVILLPERMISDLSEEARDGVIVHELSHVLRGDYGWQLLLRLVQAIFWFHPLIWLAERRIYFVRERACDEFAVHALGSGDRYAEMLLDMASRVSERPNLGLCLAVVRTRHIVARIEALAGCRGTARYQLPARVRAALTCVCLMVCAVLSSLAITRAQQPTTASEKQSSRIATDAAVAPESAKGSKAASSKAVGSERNSDESVRVAPLTVVGKAVSENGQPIAGATIYLVSTNSSQARKLAQATTNASGEYEFRDVPLPEQRSKEPTDQYQAGWFQVFGKTPGRGFAWRGMKPYYVDPKHQNAEPLLRDFYRKRGYFAGEKIELDLTFLPAARIHGRFVDEMGKPLVGVKVRIANCDFVDTTGKEDHVNAREFWAINQAAELMPDELVATTDRNGVFELKTVPPEVFCRLQINHPDFAARSLYTSTAANPPPTNANGSITKLPIAETLHAVRDVPVVVQFADTGKPAAGVRVMAHQQLASGSTAFGTSDSQGKLNFKLPPGTFHLQADPLKEMDYIRTTLDLVVKEGYDEQTAVIPLGPACVLTLKAVEVESGDPIADVEFWHVVNEQPGTGKRGRFRMGVNSTTTVVDHPKTNAAGELRVVAVPGKWEYGIGWNRLPAGYVRVNPSDGAQGRILDLPAGKAVSAEFQLRRTASVAKAAAEQKQTSTQGEVSKQPPTSKKEPEATSDTPADISGVVTLADGGGPVVGATVFLRDGGLHRATTDEQGRFEFAKAPLANYEIWAVKESLVAELQRLTAEQPKAEGGRRFAPVRLSMSHGKEIHVNVTSTTTGQPIEGARVELDYPYRQRQATDKDGKAALRGLLAQPHRMGIEADGHARVRQEFDLRSANSITEHGAILAPGGTVRGVVSDESGRPLADAKVVYLTPDSPVGFYGDSPYADKEGTFRNLHLPLDTPVRLMVNLQDHEAHQQEITLTGQRPDLTVNIQLKLRPRGGAVTGIVTDADGQPIADASVLNYGQAPSDTRSTRTDAAGKFTIDNVASGSAGYELIIRATDYATARQRFDPAKPEPLTIKLQKGHVIRARVQNDSGQPIVGAYVDINGGGHFNQAGESLRTDKNGLFSSTSLPAGSVFHVYAAGYTSIDKSLTLDSEETVVVTLGPMGMVHGEVVDESGNPIKQFRVRLDFASRQSGDVSGSMRSELRTPGLLFHSPEGRFRIQELMSGMPLIVIVEAEGYEPTRLLRVVAKPETEAPLTKVTLAKPGKVEFATVSGTVVDYAGNPVPGVQLRLIASDERPNGEFDNRFNWVLIGTGQLGQKDYVAQHLSSVTDNAGKFELKNVLPGKFLQVAYWGDRAPKGRTLKIAKSEPGGSEAISIQLPKPATLRFSFDAADYPTAEGARLMHTAIQAFLSYEMKLSKEKSEFSFENLPPGEYWLSLSGPAERNPTQPNMFSYPTLAGRKLRIEEGNAYEVQLSAADQTKRRN